MFTCYTCEPMEVSIWHKNFSPSLHFHYHCLTVFCWYNLTLRNASIINCWYYLCSTFVLFSIFSCLLNPYICGALGSSWWSGWAICLGKQGVSEETLRRKGTWCVFFLSIPNPPMHVLILNVITEKPLIFSLGNEKLKSIAGGHI